MSLIGYQNIIFYTWCVMSKSCPNSLICCIDCQIVFIWIHSTFRSTQALRDALVMKCKCHGVSGSCSIRTCWRGLQDLKDIAMDLKIKYLSATKVVHRPMGTRKQLVPKDIDIRPVRENELVYLQSSPDYCMRNDKLGSFGTQDR